MESFDFYVSARCLEMRNSRVLPSLSSWWHLHWLCIVLILAVLHGLSVLYYNSKGSDPDYKSLAEQWAGQIKDSDLIFVHGRGYRLDWLVAPIFYYLNAKRYHFVGSDFTKHIHSYPQSRVWVLSFKASPTDKEVAEALADYRYQGRVDALNITAKLYVPNAQLIETSVAKEAAPFTN